jgi:hypothetical protein
MTVKFLFPYRFKWLGLTLIITGCFFTFLYDNGIAVEFPVLAIVSSFMKTRFFIVFQANIADELALLSFFAGLILFCVTKEKNEKPEFMALRSKALLYAALLNSIFVLISILFIYGSAFIIALVVNLFSFSVFYLISFLLFKFKSRH